MGNFLKNFGRNFLNFSSQLDAIESSIQRDDDMHVFDGSNLQESADKAKLERVLKKQTKTRIQKSFTSFHLNFPLLTGQDLIMFFTFGCSFWLHTLQYLLHYLYYTHIPHYTLHNEWAIVFLPHHLTHTFFPFHQTLKTLPLPLSLPCTCM